MSLPLYLDYNATTPVDESVLEAMLPWFRTHFGNASSKGHAYGWMADEAVERARAQVAGLFKTDPQAVIFTSGATEALNLSIKGTAEALGSRGRHLVTVASEHKAVLDTHRTMQRRGFEASYLEVDDQGRLDIDAVRASIRDDTILLAVMHANNETGIIQEIEALYEVARERGIVFLSDTTQSAGKIDVDAGWADLMTCSAHKLYGPKGVGALIRNPAGTRFRLSPLIDGGGQESGLRGGTLNVAGIVGLGAAAERANRFQESEGYRLASLRDRFEQSLTDALPDIRINGLTTERLPQTSNITFRGMTSQRLIPLIRQLAVSTGSACSSGSGRPSHVLKAMGLSDEDALSSIRFSFGHYTTEDDLDRTVLILQDALEGR